MPHVKEFLNASSYAVAGASSNTTKYGYIVFRALLDSGRQVYPLNPRGVDIEGHRTYSSVLDLPVTPESLSIVTPPEITRKIIDEAIEAGVKNVWMQPGAEDPIASQRARDAGLNVIDDGSCILVLLARMR